MPVLRSARLPAQGLNLFGFFQAHADVRQMELLLESVPASMPGFEDDRLGQGNSFSVTSTRDLDTLLAALDEIMNVKGGQLEELIRSAREKEKLAELAGLSVTGLGACIGKWEHLKASLNRVYVYGIRTVSIRKVQHTSVREAGPPRPWVRQSDRWTRRRLF